MPLNRILESFQQNVLMSFKVTPTLLCRKSMDQSNVLIVLNSQVEAMVLLVKINVLIVKMVVVY